MQVAIDGGLEWCTRCDRGGYHTFCGGCGRRFLGYDRTWTECGVCKRLVPTDWCPFCGFNVKSEFLRDVMAGRVDWNARIEDARNSVAKIHRMLGLTPKMHKPPSILEAVRATFPPKEPHG